MDKQTQDKIYPVNDAFTVQRSLRIPRMQNLESVKTVKACLAGLEGVQKSETNMAQTQLRLTYDAAQIGFAVIENKMNEAGYPLANSWWTRVKYGWYCYLDDNAQNNAKSKGGACCSKPSDIYAHRRK